MARVNGTVEDRNDDGIDDRFAHVASGQLAVIRLDGETDVDAAIEELRADPEVLYAERNHIVRALATPNEPRFPELYGLDNTGQTGGTPDADIDAVETWDSTVGDPGIVVGVVDTGVDYNHEDLAGNMWVNPGEVAGNGIDDDGNGVIDDVHGFNAITGSGDPLDDHMHGTHCSGTIGAIGNNRVGVAGVNWDVQIMALKFLDSGGSGNTGDAIAAIDYAVAQRSAGVNLRVLSNSWGGDPFSQALLDAIESASDAGILFVAAAGNDASSNDDVPVYPAGYEAPNVVAVAATDLDDQLAFFSNFGATTVDLGAPGVDILSTTPGDTYSVLSGTSMATPHVSGVAALALSVNDALTVEELKDLLLASGDPIPALDGTTVSGRRLNAASALEQAGPPIPRFRLGVPPRLFVTQEETATFDIDLTAVAGFTGDVALSVVSNPAIDAALTITPVVTAPGTGTLTVATTAATARGVYSLAITGQSGDQVRSRTVSLRILAPGDPLFGVTVSPDSQTVSQDETTMSTVMVQSFGGTGNVSLSLTSDGPLSDFFFDPPEVAVPGVSRLLVSTSCDTPPGDYDLTITGTDEQSATASASAVLTVQPFGAVTTTYPSTDTPIAIPDGGADGVASAIEVGDDISIASLAVVVDIVHPSIGDLVVQLVGPDGTAVVLHDREGGDGDDIHRTYEVSELDGRSALGCWKLLVSDSAAPGAGTLAGWALAVTSVPSVFPPLAKFSYSGEVLTFEFFDESFGGGCGGAGAPIVAWNWDFGDGTTSTEPATIHVFPTAGDYTVTLTVTDQDGLSGSTSKIVTATRQPALSIFRIRRDLAHSEFRIDLRWTGAEGDLVELFRNGALVKTSHNDGKIRDRFSSQETVFTWFLCEQGTANCSNQVSVDFGPNVDAGQATVTTAIGGKLLSEKLIIEDGP